MARAGFPARGALFPRKQRTKPRSAIGLLQIAPALIVGQPQIVYGLDRGLIALGRGGQWEGSVLDSRLTLTPDTLLDFSYRIGRVVGAGGFGITYEAEDIHLGTRVAVKEYYPFDFGDRDQRMNVLPKSERHERIFHWGRTNFLQEARTLARFEHQAIVRVTRVFEANATAYMVMRFEQGASFESWLDRLGRPPSQKELDSIVAPLLEALEMMHAADFLHRDIAPDNIIVRADGTPVLLDFGAARRAVAEMSRAITGIVKPGYSPHEQYASDSRLQGPWSDLYALGATLYRAVAGRPPEEATLRVDEDRMPPASRCAGGHYRSDFLSAIDACLKVKGSERPQSVAQLRPLLLGRSYARVGGPPGAPAEESGAAGSSRTARGPAGYSRDGTKGHRRIVAAALCVLTVGAYGAYELALRRPAPEADLERLRTDQREAALDADRLLAEERARAIAAEAEARRRAAEEERARLEEQRRAEERRQAEEAERQQKEERERGAAQEAARRIAEASPRKEEHPGNVATLTEDERATFVKRIQEMLRNKSCYGGAIDGRIDDAQAALNRFVDGAERKSAGKPARIELAKATVADFESWLRDAEGVGADICAARQPTGPSPHRAVKSRQRADPSRTTLRRPAPSPGFSQPSGAARSGGTIQGIQ